MRSDAAADIIALAVYQRGQPVTLALVRSVIEELADHQGGCCQQCVAARTAKPERVLWLARYWATKR